MDPVWDKMQRLAACLCTTVDEASVDPLCFCGVLPGGAVALDYIASEGCGGDGMGWVRLTLQYPTVAFPQPIVKPQKCGVEIAAVFELGIVRTYPVREDGEPLDSADQTAMTERQLAEAQLMRKAVLCCFGSSSILGNYQPIGPDGLAIGGFWLVSVPTAEPDD